MRIAPNSPFRGVMRSIVSASDFVWVDEGWEADPTAWVIVASNPRHDSALKVRGRRMDLSALQLSGSWQGSLATLTKALEPLSWDSLTFRPAVAQRALPDFHALAKTLWTSLLRHGRHAAVEEWQRRTGHHISPAVPVVIAEGRLSLRLDGPDRLPALAQSAREAFEAEAEQAVAVFNAAAAGWLALVQCAPAELVLPPLAVSSHEALEVLLCA